MLYEVSGDILLSKAHAVAHGVAANDPMNQAWRCPCTSSTHPCTRITTTGAT